MTVVDKVMSEPVMCGGFVWEYGRILTLLQKNGISDMYLAAATNRRIDPNAPDTRKLSWERAGQLWDAMGIADMPTINACVREMA